MTWSITNIFHTPCAAAKLSGFLGLYSHPRHPQVRTLGCTARSMLHSILIFCVLSILNVTSSRKPSLTLSQVRELLSSQGCLCTSHSLCQELQVWTSLLGM